MSVNMLVEKSRQYRKLEYNLQYINFAKYRTFKVAIV